MVDLIKLLPEKDKEILISYIDKYGVAKDFFEGVDNYLVYWNQSKQKLYHALGNNFIVKKVVSIEKPADVIQRERDLLLNGADFFQMYDDDVYKAKNEVPKEHYSEVWKPIFDYLYNFSNCYCLKWDTVGGTSFKCKLKDKPTLQIQSNTKPIRAIHKILDYFDFFRKETKEEFEDLCSKLSLITNDKYIKGNLCLSIHPMDFITMSDNAENWTSCMNWSRDGGCYHAGTVEMMNSNCVVCAYLESSRPFTWGTMECDAWNSKRWRVLLYVTKDILVSGKSYPYANNSLTFAALEFMRDLVKENLNWTYQYGLEKYLDMKHILYASDMNNNRFWIRSKKTIKHNILFDTNAMYNDMFNDHHTAYWCFRNKVKKNTIINYSGRCNCLVCNRDVVYIDEYGEDTDGYNERYRNSEVVICDECIEDITCSHCGNILKTTDKIGDSFFKMGGKLVCKRCFKEFYRICPDCGAYFNATAYKYNIAMWDSTRKIPRRPLTPIKDIVSKIRYRSDNDLHLDPADYYYGSTDTPFGYQPLHMCEDCAKKFLEVHPNIMYPGWSGNYFILKEEIVDTQTKAKFAPYFWCNLKK